MAIPTFNDRPIKQKLMIVVLVTTICAMLLAGAGIIAADSLLSRRGVQRDLSALAQIIADNSTAALSFDDAQAATETLAALHARDHVVAACIFRSDSTILGQYPRQGSASRCPVPATQDQLQFSKGNLLVSHAVLLGGRRIGTLTLLYNLGELWDRAELYSGIVLAVLWVSSVVAILLSSGLRAIITKPISQLVAASTAVSETNDYGIRAQKLSSDELGVLVDRFNEMLDRIQTRDRTLLAALAGREEALRDAETARERFRFTAESMPQKIFTASPSGEIDYLNRQWSDFTGLSFEQIRLGWAHFVHPDDLEPNLEAWKHAIQTGDPFVFEHRFRRADGAYRWHLTRAHAMRDASGIVSMWIGSNTDIHEQKQKEEELRRANDDLQQFAYSASHDLQEPIRNVAVYSEIIAKRYHALLDEDGRQFLGFLTEGGRRLAALVNDLLAYTRAGMVDNDTTPVNTMAVMDHTLSSLAEAIRESGGEIAVDPLPPLRMSEAHLQQVFQNLIGNALKYRGETPPQIHVWAARQGTGWRVSVQDNGIGIDPQYKEKIFGVFKRLHRDQKYSGTGIGLAICQRVVERYGGRIWVDSKPGEGCTFHFTVPELAIRLRPAKVESSAGGGQSS